MAVSSYAGTSSSGEVKVNKDLDRSIEGRHVIIIEDIVDTGLTLSYLLANLHARGAASVKLAALLDKYERRQKEVPIDYLKIDGRVIFEILRDPVAMAKVKAIQRVCRTIGVRTIAEQVESETALLALRRLEVDYAQGFGIAAPRLFAAHGAIRAVQ